jgi:polar amino acid transport system permease protein
MAFLYWQVVWDSTDAFVNGLKLALEMAVFSMIGGSALGLLLALARTSRHRPLQWFTAVYVGIFRNIPLLLLIYFVYYGLPTIWSGYVDLADNTTSMIVALSLLYGGYLSEVFRAGIQAVGARYIEGARALGLRGDQIIRFITLPIMFRIVLPSLGNMLISLFKDTALASAISVEEITYVGEQIQTNTFRTFEAWSAVAVIYLVATSVLALVLRLAERRLAIWTD